MELTGLEQPDELWERLQEATAEAAALAAANKKLVGRVRTLERQLAEVGALTDDELVAELPRRMSRALESAQGVASEIVRRARKQDAAIREKAEETAAGIVRQAEIHATAILRQATNEAAARMASAETEAQELIGAARSRRQKVLAELEREAAALQQRLDIIDRSQSHLLRAYDVVERTLLEARTALTPERQSGPIAPAPEPERLDHRPASDAANGTSHGSGLGRLAGREAEGPDPDDLPRPAALRVYDWSPTASRAG